MTTPVDDRPARATTRPRRLVAAYPFVIATGVVGVVALVLTLTPAAGVTPWLVTVYAALVAIRETVTMVRSLLGGRVGLDLLAVVSITATLLVGEYWAALIVVLMLTGGEALEDFAAGRAQRELQALLDRAPRLAHRLTGEGGVEDIPVEEVQVGDLLLVRPSEIVPVDAALVTAAAEFDESSLTGESLPVEKRAGEHVMSGSLNGVAAVQLRATALAADSQYQRIVALVREATASRAPLVRLADRYAVPFTAVSLAIAAVAWWISGDPVRFAEVLVVATPCPLLIAAPVAFMAGMSGAARHGVVVKNAGTLERLARVRTLAFDKTGTLTRGHPEVSEFRPEGGADADELLRWAAAAERYSSHVLASSIVAEAERRGLQLPEAASASEIATNGVLATFDGVPVVVGKPSFVEANCVGFRRVDAAEGEAVVYVARAGRYLGAILLRDAVRDESAATVSWLRGAGVARVLLVTGDIETTARHVADQVGVTEVHAQTLPEDKVRIVGSATPRPVAMVGDGVNDAPVLAAADVGIALGARGSTVASESADVVILVDDLSRVATAFDIARRTLRIALESIWVGIAISIGLMLVATTGVLPAVVGAGLQEVVDVITILNALRALRDPRNTERPAATDGTLRDAAGR